MKINELKIFTPNLNNQIKFYSGILNLEIIQRSQNQASFKVGSSILTIELRKKFTPYHFAINIPLNSENEALKWLKERVVILLDEGIEIQNFDFWNAKAIYFYDSDKNIVEFIMRKNRNISSSHEFNQESLLEISEIGLPTVNIQKELSFLNKECGLTVFSGGIERFCVIGDEQGLIVCINKNKKKWFPVDDIAYSSDFLIEIENKNKLFHIEYKNETLKV